MGKRWFLVGMMAIACGCDGPPDGVLSLAFGLATPAVVSLPSEAELGAKLDPAALSQAKGKCVGTPPTYSVELVIEGFPQLAAPMEKAHYRFTLLFGHEQVQPQSASLERLTRALSLDGTIGVPSGQNEQVVGTVTPDALGRSKLLIKDVHEAEKIAGGWIDIVVVPTDGSSSKVYKILEGRVGNLSDSGDQVPTEPEPSGGGHSH